MTGADSNRAGARHRGRGSAGIGLNRVAVTAGQGVDQGALLGQVGSTGNSSGPHLHYEQCAGSSVQAASFHGTAFVSGSRTSQNCVDVPAAGDFLGGPEAELAVFRRDAEASFRIMRGDRSPKVVRLGSATDQPVVGDWDGDGRADPGVRTPSTRTFQLASAVDTVSIVLGTTTDVPVAADGTVTSALLGDADDLPVTGDWDGDGGTDLGVWTPTTAMFSQRRAPTPTAARAADRDVQFGRPRG